MTPKLIVPFGASETAFDPDRRRNFNYELSTGRVRIEQVFGIIKRIFTCLALPKLCSFEKHNDITEVCFILYNIFIDLNEIDTTNMHLNETSFENQDNDMLLTDCIANMQDQHRIISMSKGYTFLRTSDYRIRKEGKERRNELINEFLVYLLT